MREICCEVSVDLINEIKVIPTSSETVPVL